MVANSVGVLALDLQVDTKAPVDSNKTHCSLKDPLTPLDPTPLLSLAQASAKLGGVGALPGGLQTAVGTHSTSRLALVALCMVGPYSGLTSDSLYRADMTVQSTALMLDPCLWVYRKYWQWFHDAARLPWPFVSASCIRHPGR